MLLSVEHGFVKMRRMLNVVVCHTPRQSSIATKVLDMRVYTKQPPSPPKKQKTEKQKRLPSKSGIGLALSTA